jgi:hypothetical protein
MHRDGLGDALDDGDLVDGAYRTRKEKNKCVEVSVLLQEEHLVWLERERERDPATRCYSTR